MIFATLKRYLLTLIDLMGWKVALALGLMISLGLTEGVSLLMLVPLLQSVGLDVQQGSISRLAGFVSSLFSAVGIRPTLIAVLCVYIFIVIVHSLLRRWETSVSLTLEYEFIVHLRQRLYQAIADTNWLFFSRHRSSDFTHALTIEMEEDRCGNLLRLKSCRGDDHRRRLCPSGLKIVGADDGVGLCLRRRIDACP